MNGRNIDQFIRGVRLDRDKVESFDKYPFSLRAVREMDRIEFQPNVTFIVGENGLYILDEPEAALSPIRQMSLISRIDELVKGGSQFIIATHSPILMAYPKSFIYEIKENIERVSYEESENYNSTKDFLNNYKKMIHILTK